MHRRKVLTGVALTFSLTGCSSTEDVGTEGSPTETATSGGQTTGESTATATDSPTDSPTESGEPDVTMSGGTFGTADFGYTEYPYYEVELTNQGNSPSGIVEVVVDWLDDNDNYVDDTREEVVSLKPGETWIARSYNILESDKVASAEASGGYDLVPPEWPDGLEVASSKLLAGEDNVKVRASIENNTGQMVDYVTFFGKVYDGDGNVLGQVWTIEDEVDNGSSWQAEAEWDDVARANLVEDHEVILEGNIY